MASGARLPGQRTGGTRSDLGERQQPQERPRRERAHEQQDRPGERPGDAVSGRVCSGGQRRTAQRQNRHDGELRHHERNEEFDGADCPDAARGPDHAGKRQGQHQHDHVHGGISHQQLNPEHDRASDDEESKEKGHERSGGDCQLAK
jgi:hypothetical protein